MKTYIGSKIIKAEFMSRCMFERDIQNKPEWDEFEDEPGYHVVYPGHDGKPEYHSWSPAEVLENAYRELTDGEVAFITGMLKQ